MNAEELVLFLLRDLIKGVYAPPKWNRFRMTSEKEHQVLSEASRRLRQSRDIYDLIDVIDYLHQQERSHKVNWRCTKIAKDIDALWREYECEI